MEKIINKNFPQLQVQVYNKPLVYLDSAATTLKCKTSIQRLNDFYLYEAANVHRGAHRLSDVATSHYESARKAVQKFIGAEHSEEIVFTRGTTESINLLAQSLGQMWKASNNNGLGDKLSGKILLTEMEHHSNIVAWQMLTKVFPQLYLEYVRIKDNGDLDLEDLDKKLNQETRVISFTACSNVLGTLNPVGQICEKARKLGVISIVDAAQWVAARPTDVIAMDCDFLVFSGHKIFAPFGIGVLYGRRHLLNNLPPYQGGGSMINKVEEDESTYLESPFRFEAGTPNIGGALALGEALNFVSQIGFDKIRTHEESLTKLALSGLEDVEGIEIVGQPQERSNIISFVFDGAHHSDVGALLDRQGIAIRTGHHCCQILMKRLGLTGTARIAFSIYNTESDVQQLLTGLKKVKEFL